MSTEKNDDLILVNRNQHILSAFRMRLRPIKKKSLLIESIHLLYMFIWRSTYGFEAGEIHYEVHWKGWALEIETILGPEMATNEASAIWAQKSRFCD